MAWPIPQPTDIYNRAGASFVGQFPSFQPTAPNTVCGAIGRIVGMSGFDLYLYQGYIMNELFPDTSEDNLDRHAAIWGLTRIPAQAASGTVTWGGTTGTVLPAGIVFSDAYGNAYLNTAGGTVAGGTITLAVSAASAGAQGNVLNGALLTPVSPVGGMSASAVVASTGAGFSGGAPAETDTALRARLLQRIRARGRGGNVADYQAWCEQASSSVVYVQAIPNWLGPGSVGVFVAGAGPTAIGSGPLAAISAFLGAQYAAGGAAPVTAYVVVQSATLYPVNATVHLNPDTANNRAAATAAFDAWVATDAEIGATMFMSRLDAALEGADGEFSHERTFPTADLVLNAGVIAVAGTLSFV